MNRSALESLITHGSCTSPPSAPRGDGAKRHAHRTDPSGNAKAAQQPLCFLSYVPFLSIPSLFAISQQACVEQNHSVSGVQHLHPRPQFRVLQRLGGSVFPPT